ncbi:hypothetical protein EJB05_41380 [Eragrostis curvula]|uniref:Uncharacterized protein n=1 Tax=Eragrostis curvula TaxID=38414 RepID=A0A5J9TAL6_9POAL|nr:hypothetical protein EJB05_41380 [Eragrostis curvula]
MVSSRCHPGRALTAASAAEGRLDRAAPEDPLLHPSRAAARPLLTEAKAKATSMVAALFLFHRGGAAPSYTEAKVKATRPEQCHPWEVEGQLHCSAGLLSHLPPAALLT